MNLVLERRWCMSDSAQGELYIDGVFECFTLEDSERPEGAFEALCAKLRAGAPMWLEIRHGSSAEDRC